MQAAQATVTSLERSLGVWVPVERAEAIAARWRVLGLHHVRVVARRA